MSKVSRPFVFCSPFLFCLQSEEAKNLVYTPPSLSFLFRWASNRSWHPVVISDTTTPSYWLNWRFLLCAIWVLTSIVLASLLIWKYEGSSDSEIDGGEPRQGKAGTLYEDDAWKPCLKDLHPAWLLAFRIIAFFVLLALLIANVIVDGGGIFFFYTQWTFTLVTIYFGLGSLLSIFGCYQYHHKFGGYKVNHSTIDAERGTNMASMHGENANTCYSAKTPDPQEERHVHQTAGIWSYVFQVIFQMNAGAVVLTDIVFWLILFPFLTMKDYKLTFLKIGMHSINAIILLGDMALNCLRFPLFRFAYFILWTGIYVIFQWLVHACISIWWPYPFLDLSSSYAPVWYLSVALMHFPCYGIFALLIRMKHFLMLRWFPQSYQCMM